MVDLQYVELVGACVSQDVLQKFDCGHPDFNNFWLMMLLNVAIMVRVLHIF